MGVIKGDTRSLDSSSNIVGYILGYITISGLYIIGYLWGYVIVFGLYNHFRVSKWI